MFYNYSDGGFNVISDNISRNIGGQKYKQQTNWVLENAIEMEYCRKILNLE